MTCGTACRSVVSIVALALLLALISGCGPGSPDSSVGQDAAAPTPSAPPTATPLIELDPVVFAGPVYQPDSNRLAKGSGLATGFIHQLTTKDVNLGATPTWISGVSTPEGDVWAVALADGTVVGYRIPIGGQPVEVAIPGERLVPGQPPVLAVQGASVRLATTPANASPHSVPVRLSGDRTIYIDNLHRLTVLEPDGNLWRPDLQVLPDTRVVQISPEQVLVLAEPTDRYPHSALGDNLEATALVRVTVGANRVETVYQSEGDVIESIAPLLADVDGDGADDVALVVSGAEEIGVVVASITGGGVIATSDRIDRRLGWRHLVAVGPLGPNGETELAEVQYPDTDGVVGFLRLDGNHLGVEASLGSYRSHDFGARNLEQALVADVDRDGQPEVVVPSRDKQAIAGIRHASSEAVEMWARPVGGTLATNIAVLIRPDGTLSLAAGTQEGSLRAWQ